MTLHFRILLNMLGVFSAMCRRTPLLRPHRDVATPQGTVRGYLTPTHAAYLGIPYARTPTQQYRYKAPEPPPTWDGIFEASHKIKCPQLGEDGDENCLVINIFTPQYPTLLPVYVLVHDGDFKSGWGPHEPLSRILREGYILVTFNYRLGALGYLCLGTDEALGNAGLKDQINALYWINKNIEYFGGDPDEVILHGIKSAATSIQLLLLSGLVDGFVHKVIAETNSVLSPLSMTYDPITIAYDAAVSKGYKGRKDTEELYKFYNKSSPQDLLIEDAFLPCFEDVSNIHSLINFDPILRLRKGNYVKVPIMITYTHAYDIGNASIDTNNLMKNIIEMLPANLAFENDLIKERIGQIVKEFYFGNGVIEYPIAEQRYLDLNYDLVIEYPVVKLALLYATNNPYMVYLLKFTLDNAVEDSSVVNIGSILENLKMEDDENIILQKLITLWRNFIKIGDPTPLTTSLIPVIWQPVVTETAERTAITNVPTLHFGSQLRIILTQRNQQLLFWHNIYNRFYKPHIFLQNNTENLNDNI